MNLYSRKHVLEGARIDVKMAELKKELEAAKKLPAVTGYDDTCAPFFFTVSIIFLADASTNWWSYAFKVILITWLAIKKVASFSHFYEYDKRWLYTYPCVS